MIGTAFFVMDCVHGRVFPEPLAAGGDPGRARPPSTTTMNDVLARLHTVDGGGDRPRDFGRPGNYFARQIHRWTQQYRASETEKIESMEQPDRLAAGPPAGGRHHDPRPRRLPARQPDHPSHRAARGGRARLGAVDARPPARRPRLQLHALLHRQRVGRLLRQGSKALGIPSEQEFVGAYCRRVGRASIPDWDFYVVFAMFRLAAIAQGIMGRVIAGTANDPHAR